MSLFSKKESKTLGDRLPYYSFDRETDAIWLKDGSATLSLRITPKDCSHLTDDELESLRFGLTPVLSQLPEGSVFQALMLRERSTDASNEAYRSWRASHLSDQETIDLSPRLQLLQAREALLKSEFLWGNVFQTRCYVTLRSLPDLAVKTGKNLGPFSYLAFSSLQRRKTEYRGRAEILRDLEAGLVSLRAGLEAIGFDVAPVGHAERLKIIYEWMNPERSRSVAVPQEVGPSSIADRVALTDLVEDRSGLALGRIDAKVVSLKALPEISIPAAMEGLAQAALPFSLILTVYVLPQTEERERLMRKQRMAQGMASGNAVRNLMAEAQLTDIESTLSALISSGERLLAVSFQLVGMTEAHS